MESVSDMLRPLHFVFLFAAFAFIAFAAAAAVENGKAPANVQSEVGPQPDANDLETDATSYWGYGRPYYSGWGGYGRGYGGYGGYGGWGGWGSGLRGGYWGGRGWGGRGLGGWGGWGGGYWG